MDPELEKKLKALEKKSKYAPLREVSQKIRQGVYQENTKQLKKNKRNLTKKVDKWKRKMDKGDEQEKKKYFGKFEFGKGLLDLLAGKKDKKKEDKKKEEKKTEKKDKKDKKEVKIVESDSNSNSNSDPNLNSDIESNQNIFKTEVQSETEEERKKRIEEKEALIKRIGEASVSLPPPDVKVELEKFTSLAAPLSKEVQDEIKILKDYKNAYESKMLNFKKGNFELTDSKEPIFIQATANAARVFLELQDKEELFPVVQKPTLATGDCFYSAIYRSAKERGYLDELEECLELDIEDENKFIQSLRNVIADEIFNDRLPGEKTKEGYLDTYDYLIQNYVADPKTYRTVIQGFPFWFRDKFKNGPGEKKQFLNQLASHTMTMTEWVGEIEVKIAQRLFKT